MKTENLVCDRKIVYTHPSMDYLMYELKVMGYSILESRFLIFVVKYNIISIVSTVHIIYIVCQYDIL